MGMTAILFSGAEPFEQIVNTHLTEGPMWNMVKIAQVVSEKKMFNNYTILYMYIAQGQRQIFYHLWAWWPSWFTDHDNLYKFSIPL